MVLDLNTATRVIKALQDQGVDPLFYGSLGISIYLGPYKTFDDIDLLLEDAWLTLDWNRLVKIMERLGYELVDLHEHMFRNEEDIKVAFASQDILFEDKIVHTGKDIVWKELHGITFKTLSLDAFHRAYQFSSKDGYRQSKRVMKDAEVLALIGVMLKRKPELKDTR